SFATTAMNALRRFNYEGRRRDEPPQKVRRRRICVVCCRGRRAICAALAVGPRSGMHSCAWIHGNRAAPCADDLMAEDPTFFADIKQYIGFDERDSAVLRTLEPYLEGHFVRIAEHFYERILAHPRAHAAITGGTEQVERLKKTLVDWMASGLRGPHDEVFYERRARIGRIHVQIGLPQQYMVTAMNVMRIDYRDVLRVAVSDCDALIDACSAVDRLFDLELAVMFQTYQT